MPSLVTFLLLGFALGLLALLYLVWEPRKVRHHRLELPFETLPEAFDGYTILYLSDTHFHRREREKRRVLERLARTQGPADLCVVTGDLIETDAGVENCRLLLEALRGRDGTLAVLGNHDYYRYTLLDMMLYREITGRLNDTERLIRSLAASNIRVLRNRSVEIRRGPHSLWVAGVDDPVTHRADVAAAMRDVPEGAFALLLAHTPDVLMDAPLDGERLVLAGHTHGGQVRIPFYGPVMNHSRLRPGFVSGRIRLGDTLLLVSNGLGVNRLFPFRFRCRPEIHTIRLRRASTGPAGRQDPGRG